MEYSFDFINQFHLLLFCPTTSASKELIPQLSLGSLARNMSDLAQVPAIWFISPFPCRNFHTRHFEEAYFSRLVSVVKHLPVWAGFRLRVPQSQWTDPDKPALMENCEHVCLARFQEPQTIHLGNIWPDVATIDGPYWRCAGGGWNSSVKTWVMPQKGTTQTSRKVKQRNME